MEERTFRDLKDGDLVWVIEGTKIIEEKVIEAYKAGFGRFIVKLPYSDYYGYPGSKWLGNMFVNEGDAYEQLKKKLGKRKQTLEKNIDSLVSKFDALDSISIPPTVKPSTIIPSMKELKPGDSVWWVDKVGLKIVEKKIEKRGIELIKPPYRLEKSLKVFVKSYESFYAFPCSHHSVRLLYYTTEEQAWKYMLEWGKSRMRTVGNEMEKLMKELEEIERNEKIWGSTEG